MVYNKVWQTLRSVPKTLLTAYRCCDDVKSLSCYIDAQRIAFHKILKKYKVCAGTRGTMPLWNVLTCTLKWTGSQTVGTRFKDEVLGSPESFINCDFEHLMSQYDEVLTALRASTPASSEPETPITRSRQPSVQTLVQEVR
jgi:hypothetical protein